MAKYRFYHIIRLTDRLVTPGNPKYVSTQRLVLDALGKMDLNGKRVLDIGCRDGLFSFEAERRGASEVIAIDNNLSRPAVEFLIPYFGSRVHMHEKNVLDLQPDTFGKFDVIVFAGVLYHLRYPFWALRLVRDLLADGGTLILETAVWRGDRHHAMLYCPVEDESPYEATSCTFFNEKGLRATLESLGFSVEAPRYRSQTEPVKDLLREAKQWMIRLSKRLNGLHVRTGIDRGLFVCTLSRLAENQMVARYWEGTHDIHTRTGG
jgi:SAM-dependent methyltransferase